MTVVWFLAQLTMYIQVRDASRISSLQVKVPVITAQPGNLVGRFVEQTLSVDMTNGSPIAGSGYTIYTMKPFSFVYQDIEPTMSFDLIGLRTSDNGGNLEKDFVLWGDLPFGGACSS